MLRLDGRSARHSRPVSGFTLVEILIVIATIAVLLAIILPLFTHVRDLAYKTECACNMRRLGEAFHLYANDWGGWWPAPGGLPGDRAYWAQSGPGGLNAYVRQQGIGSVWCCPLLTEWKGRFPARSYTMNSYLRTPCDVEYPTCVSILRGIHTQAVREPQRTVLLYEGIPRSTDFQDKAYSEDQIYYIYRCANWTWVRGFYNKVTYTINPGQPWHGTENNYLYADCHVVARPPGRKTTGSYSSYGEMYEWYVDKAYFRRRYAGLNE